MSVSLIALQIQSSMQTTQTLSTHQKTLDGKESLRSSYGMEIQTSSQIQNREDVHVLKEIWHSDSVGIVSCMSRNDAAKPYMAKMEETKERLRSDIAVAMRSQHPQEKILYAKRSEYSFIQYQKDCAILISLGIAPKDSTLEKEYTTLKESFEQFKATWKFYYVGKMDNALEKSLIEEIRKEVHIIIDSSIHESGVNLSLQLSDMTCKEGSFGISCERPATLEGKDINGETLFALERTLKGVGRNQDEAEKRLINGDKKFIKDWIGELRKWDVR